MLTISGALNPSAFCTARSPTAASSFDRGSCPSTASAHITVERCLGSPVTHSLAARLARASTVDSGPAHCNRAIAHSAFATDTTAISGAIVSTSSMSFLNRASFFSDCTSTGTTPFIFVVANRATRCTAVETFTLLKISAASSTKTKMVSTSIASSKSPCKSFARSSCRTACAALDRYSLGNISLWYAHFRFSNPTRSSFAECASTKSTSARNRRSSTTNDASFRRNRPPREVRLLAMR
mmetsp:Transcript_4327/g.16026  ORF Transcript_4327/g.16026 Transcript_4327/m.16026 type:complete len:239 (+) Transcript_4327:3286-4002(+)